MLKMISYSNFLEGNITEIIKLKSFSTIFR